MTPKKNLHLLNIALFFCSIATLVVYDILGGLWLKGLTSFWFVLLGLVNLYSAQKVKLPDLRFLLWIEAGLFLGMCADVLLHIQFVLGILSFALGHICYLVAFCILEKLRRKDLIPILPIAALSLYIVTGLPYLKISDPLIHKFLMVYSLIIACMLGKSISNYISHRSTFRLLVLIGSAMFWFSDLMLAFDTFGTPSRLTWILCSYVYWPAQNILAYSLFHHFLEQAELRQTVDRITRMEQYFDTLTQADPRAIWTDPELSEMLFLLTEYYEKGQWQADYEADERGQIPHGLKRGVLSQDGLWDLLQRLDSNAPGRYNRSSEHKEEFP